MTYSTDSRVFPDCDSGRLISRVSVAALRSTFMIQFLTIGLFYTFLFQVTAASSSVVFLLLLYKLHV